MSSPPCPPRTVRLSSAAPAVRPCVAGSAVTPAPHLPHEPRSAAPERRKIPSERLVCSHQQGVFNPSLAHNGGWSSDYLKHRLTRVSALVGGGLSWTRMASRGLPFPTVPHVFPTTRRAWGTSAAQPRVPRTLLSPVTWRDGRAASRVADDPRPSVASVRSTRCPAAVPGALHRPRRGPAQCPDHLRRPDRRRGMAGRPGADDQPRGVGATSPPSLGGAPAVRRVRRCRRGPTAASARRRALAPQRQRPEGCPQQGAWRPSMPRSRSTACATPVQRWPRSWAPRWRSCRPGSASTPNMGMRYQHVAAERDAQLAAGCQLYATEWASTPSRSG